MAGGSDEFGKPGGRSVGIDLKLVEEEGVPLG